MQLFLKALETRILSNASDKNISSGEGRQGLSISSSTMAMANLFPFFFSQTERTHEENQERAYIAASRRSDRSLEARVESARRASEIHKRRTGRSLRVTEQDVINEEMYEEEDDDLPQQYRRLTAHLQTSNADFNRRLQDYLTTHVAMRSALAYGQQYPNIPQFANPAIFPPPMLAPQYQQQQMQPQMQPQYSPTMSRQAPYPPIPRPQQQGLHSPHYRSASIAAPQDVSAQAHSSPVIPPNNERRASMPTVQTQNIAPGQTQTGPHSASPRPRPSFQPGSFQNIPRAQWNQTPADQNNFSSQVNTGTMGSSGGNTFPPFYPFDGTQMFLGPILDDPGTSNLLAGNQYYQPFNNDPTFSQTGELGKQQNYPSLDGLQSTLAPSANASKTENSAEIDISEDFFGQAMFPDEGTPTMNAEAWDSLVDLDSDQPPFASQ